MRKLACLSADPISLQQHLRGAITAYEQALARDPGSTAGGDLGRLLLFSGDFARARQVLTRHLLRHPGDSEARLARAQAALRAADLPAARRDCASLGLPALE
ncbi:MAG: tetratricopeptide repeat protein [Planctomycetota bacterium]|nr:MAG: tetratricopeptide repeat protein [Planctomycetota bacterium]